MKIYIAPHDLASEGSKLLAEKLDAKRIAPEESRYVFKNDHIVLGWGNSKKAPWYIDGIRMLNIPDAVALAVDKVKALKKLKESGVSVPEFSTNIEDAKAWSRAGNIVFCRTKTRASGGDGIVVAHNEGEIIPAPLFTLYKKKKAEYRVAIVDGIVIDFMQKKKRADWNVEEKGEINIYIRSHENGWVFCRENVNPPNVVLQEAVKAVKALGLDFGSVDLVFNENENKCYTLEINSSPGMEENGTSLERYSQAFLNLVNNRPIVAAAVVVAEPVAAPAPAAVIAPVAAPVAPRPAVPQVVPAPVPPGQPQIIKIDDAKNLEIILDNGKITVYVKKDGEYYPVRVAVIDGQNLKVNKF